MITLKRIGLTLGLTVVQPLKLVVNLIFIVAAVSADVGREFIADVRSIWKDPL